MPDRRDRLRGELTGRQQRDTPAASGTASSVDLLGADERSPGVRQTVQATLDLASGLGLATLLTDDRRRRNRIARQWAATRR